METSVNNVFSNYPAEYRDKLLEIKKLIYDIANDIPEVGTIEESLKWGQPTYSTIETKAGTPIRLDKLEEGKVAIFFHCQTNLISSFRSLFGSKLEFSKNRAIVLECNKELPTDELSLCIEIALTYHLKKER